MRQGQNAKATECDAAGENNLDVAMRIIGTSGFTRSLGDGIAMYGIGGEDRVFLADVGNVLDQCHAVRRQNRKTFTLPSNVPMTPHDINRSDAIQCQTQMGNPRLGSEP